MEVALAALQNEDEYLIRKHTVFFAPSLGALDAMAHESPQSRYELLAVANPSLPDNRTSPSQGFVTRSGDLLRGKKLVPLPETETEAKTIARMYGLDRSKVLLGRDARRRRSRPSQAATTSFILLLMDSWMIPTRYIRTWCWRRGNSIKVKTDY